VAPEFEQPLGPNSLDGNQAIGPNAGTAEANGFHWGGSACYSSPPLTGVIGPLVPLALLAFRLGIRNWQLGLPLDAFALGVAHVVCSDLGRGVVGFACCR
jgi:hypothetical protein